MTKYIKNKITELIDSDEYEIPSKITETEAMIYDWVVEHFGCSEAEDPSWNISALAAYIEDMRDLQQSTGTTYKQSNTVKYIL